MILSYKPGRAMALMALMAFLLCCHRDGNVAPPLPTLRGEEGLGECNAWMKEPLNAAVWADTADSLIVGIVGDVRAVTVPFAWSGGIREPEECSGTLLPALQVRLDEVKTYAGANLDGEEVVLTFGVGILQSWGYYWGHTIFAEDDGAVAWGSEDLGRIAPGQRLGIDMQCDPDWGNCGNAIRPLFMLDRRDRLQFQEVLGGCQRVPEGLEGVLAQDLSDKIAEARATAQNLEELVARRRGIFLDLSTEQRYVDYYAAGCLTQSTPCDPPCSERYEFCDDGVCIEDRDNPENG